MKKETVEQYGLSTYSDLTAASGELVFGGNLLLPCLLFRSLPLHNSSAAFHPRKSDHSFFPIPAYLVELLKGNRTPGYVAVFSAFLLIPFLFTFFIYRREKGSRAIRVTAAIGYGISKKQQIMTKKGIFLFSIPFCFGFCTHQSLTFQKRHWKTGKWMWLMHLLQMRSLRPMIWCCLPKLRQYFR